MYCSTFSYILHPERTLEYYEQIVPVGYRFSPTTKELLQYLDCKKSGNALANIIKEVPLYNYSPFELQRHFNNGKVGELYLFTTITNLVSGSRANRKAGNGWWKNRDSEEIRENNTLIGYKTVLSFVDEKKKTTGWNMHEYSLPLFDHGNGNGHGKRKMKDKLVLCMIYWKRLRSYSRPCELSVADGHEVETDNISWCSSQSPTHESVTNDPDQSLLFHVMNSPEVSNSHDDEAQLSKIFRDFKELL